MTNPLATNSLAGSDEAFSDIVHQHIHWVHSLALRQVRDPALADDVTQAVFIVLAKKLGKLPKNMSLEPWLFKVTRFAALEALRSRQRRQLHEQRAAAMRPELPSSVTHDQWEELAPFLDPLVAKLNRDDRQAVLLHFYKQLTFPEMSQRLGISDEAARKRTQRAVGKLREMYSRRGITVGSSASLAAVLIAKTTTPAHAALISTITATSLSAEGAAATSAASAIAKGVVTLMTLTKTALAVAAAAILIAGASIVTWKMYHESASLQTSRTISSFTTSDGRKILEQEPLTRTPWNPSMDSFILAATLDSRGRIWAGAEEKGGAWLYDPANTNTPWRRFGKAQGVSDDAIYTLATDTQGRIWAGHLRSGVSVFNGQSWKNYGPLEGPLGQRVFRIAINPANSSHAAGDVWIATDLGLTRYSPSSDSWSYFTRADGLPSDQASAIAFDKDGNLYLATQCDGIAIASATDDYRSWRQVPGPEHSPTAPSGPGLPSNRINDILVSRDGAIYAATPNGLAWSNDHGQTWTFTRGADWEEKVRQSFAGPPPDWKPSPGATLAEDYVSCLAEDQAGMLWVGHRTKGYECLEPKTFKVRHASAPSSQPSSKEGFCASILARPDQPPLVGTRLGGLLVPNRFFTTDQSPLKTAAPPNTAAFPSPAKAPSLSQLQALIARARSTPTTKMSSDHQEAVYVGEDWTTQGDWIGRYGRQQAFMAFPPLGHDDPGWAGLSQNEPSALAVWAGPHLKDGAVHGYYKPPRDPISPRSLYLPAIRKYFQDEWNDGGWQQKLYGRDWEGPDLYFNLTVPAGTHRLSLYVFNNDGKKTLDAARRDYLIEVKGPAASVEEAQSQPTLAHARVPTSLNPVYKTFLLSQGSWWIRVASNYSATVKVEGIFLDRADAPPSPNDDATSQYLDGVAYALPSASPPGVNESADLKAARDLWSALDDALKNPASAPIQLPYRMLAYRAASASGADLNLLAYWRLTLHLWTPSDRAQWNAAMAASPKIQPSPRP